MSTVVRSAPPRSAGWSKRSRIRAIQTALDHGVNHVDVAPRYGDAELRLRPDVGDPRAHLPRVQDDRAHARGAGPTSTARSSASASTASTSTSCTRSASGTSSTPARPGAARSTSSWRRASRGSSGGSGSPANTHDAPGTHLGALERFDFDTFGSSPTSGATSRPTSSSSSGRASTSFAAPRRFASGSSAWTRAVPTGRAFDAA